MSHSIIAPSSAGIWGKPNGCTGYVAMSAAYPELEESEESREGTATHELSEILINMSRVDTVTPNNANSLLGMPLSNGVIATEDMLDAAWMYADEVARVANANPDSKLFLEDPIKSPSIHAESFGTPDAWLYKPSGNVLYLWDFKYGFGVVEAFENWQAINYLSGIFDKLGIDGISDRTLTVHITIVQPRAFHRDGPVRTWTLFGSELRGYFNILNNNAHTALSDKAETHTGEHCRYCEARHACPAALKAGLELYEVTGTPLPVELSNEAMGVQLAIIRRARKHLEYLESGFEEQLKGKIRAGTNVPGWMLEQGFGREKWAKPVSEVIALGDMLETDLRKPADVITPTQARKLGIDNAVIKMYSEKPQTGLKLVPANNKKAKEVFSK